MYSSSAGNNIFKLQLPFAGSRRRRSQSAKSNPIEKILGLNSLNRWYSSIKKQNPGENQFWEVALRMLNVRYHLEEQDLPRIPEKGRVVVVANHPFGGIEGIILLAIMKKIRPDVKILANSLLNRIPEMRKQMISVNPFGGEKALRSNIRGIREAIEWLDHDGMLLVFPAGEVSHRTAESRAITDPEWSPTVGRLIRRTSSPVLPIYFGGQNGRLFQMMGLIHPRLRTLMLPRELINKSGKTFEVRVGNVIPDRKLSGFPDDQSLIRYLRKRTYFLGSQRLEEKRGNTSPNIMTLSNAVPVDPAVSVNRLAGEIRELPYGSLLVESGDLEVYLARADEIPDLLLEIGRLREITFRAVGEGTGKAIDLDRYDYYYHHLILWDKERLRLVGSYRLGKTDEILGQGGVNDLYTSTLFDIHPDLFEYISPALELGRSFIRPEYQKSFAPLMLLWKGIGTFVARNPQYCYLFGPVSISSDYKSESRQILVEYLEQHQNEAGLADLVKPKTPFQRYPLSNWEVEALHELVSDLDEVTSLISDIESSQKGIPVLLRQYLKLGGRIIGFNVDPSFNNVLDGLILVDLRRTDRKMLSRYMGKEATDTFMRYHDRKELVTV